MKKKRYSNWLGGETDGMFIDLGVGGDYSDVATHQTYTASGSGWTAQNTVDTINTGANMLTTILTSIFGRNNIQQANYANQMYAKEQQTNTILVVVIGLLLVLGVVLVIRKTK